MEQSLRTVLIDWLAAAPALSTALNAITHEAPLAATPPWLGIASSASIDWGTKTNAGREVRLALELHTRTRQAGDDPELADAVQTRVLALPRSQPGFHIASVRLLRARTRQLPRAVQATLLEFRFRTLAD